MGERCSCGAIGATTLHAVGCPWEHTPDPAAQGQRVCTCSYDKINGSVSVPFTCAVHGAAASTNSASISSSLVPDQLAEIEREIRQVATTATRPSENTDYENDRWREGMYDAAGIVAKHRKPRNAEPVSRSPSRSDLYCRQMLKTVRCGARLNSDGSCAFHPQPAKPAERGRQLHTYWCLRCGVAEAVRNGLCSGCE